MNDLVKFLLARIAEDETDARLFLEQRARLGAPSVGGSYVIAPFDGPGHPGDPTRALAECNAKRCIVVRCQEMLTAAVPMAVHLARKTLEDLSRPYADHPNYRPEWSL